MQQESKGLVGWEEGFHSEEATCLETVCLGGKLGRIEVGWSKNHQELEMRKLL